MTRLASEIRSTFDSVEEIKLGPKLESCKYLEAVIGETLRISPSLAGPLPRQVEAGGLKVLGHYFPEGVELAVPIYALHHNERYYPDPHRYIPERWIVEESGEEFVERCRSAFQPFSYGSRQCIGKRLAYIELYITIARAAFLFEIEYLGGGREKRLGPDVLEYELIDHIAASRDGPLIQFTKIQPMQIG
jgi:cytochrome P450